MILKLYAHPFSAYCQKVTIALYEHGVPFDLQLLDPDNQPTMTRWARLWPLKRMPVLVDDGRTVVESSIIIEHLDIFHPGATRLVPEDPQHALEARMMDRFFDNYVMTPVQKIVDDSMRGQDDHDPAGVAKAHDMLDTAYRWLDDSMAGHTWAARNTFGLADCAAAPALFYADWVHAIDASLAQVRAYRQRLLARASIARAVDEARPYRKLFPLGAPDRD